VVLDAGPEEPRSSCERLSAAADAAAGRATVRRARDGRRGHHVARLTERVVARPRLERLIELLVERYPAVWVAASAGAGKTTAVVQAAATGNPSTSLSRRCAMSSGSSDRPGRPTAATR
jgi:hypothetical protein